MGGKKWCEYCRVNIDYTKKAIQQHEQTRLHIQNKDRHIKHERHKLRKQGKDKRLNEANPSQPSEPKPAGQAGGPFPTPPAMTANPFPKKPKISQQQRAEFLKQQNEFKANAMSKIHTLIAEKTKGQFGALVDFPEENPLLIKETYYDKVKPKKVKQEGSGDEEEDGDEDQEGSEDSDDVQMWSIQMCEETQKPCFVNNITGAKLYEKPKGVMLSEKQLTLWQQLCQYAQQNPPKNPQEQVQIGQWQQVPNEQNIFMANAVLQQSSQSDLQQLPDLPRPKTIQQQHIDKIQQKICKGEIKSAAEVVDMMIECGTEQTGESLREKNAKLKKLIENNFMQTAQMNRDKKEQGEDEYVKAAEGFKPRKKVKTAKLTTEEDLY